MCFALVGLYSCGSDDDDDNGGGDSGITIKARVLYSTDADGVNTSPDAGAKVCVLRANKGVLLPKFMFFMTWILTMPMYMYIKLAVNM